MSHSGKTYWSKLLAKEFGYEHVEFDELIGASPKIADFIRDIEGKDRAERMGKWFGMPQEPGFQEKEDRFLAVEKGFMSAGYNCGIILDLTGSAIYVPDQLERLAQTGLVIHLATSKEVQDENIAAALKGYVEKPRPVCWNGNFKPEPGETGKEDTLKRCYPLLVNSRAELYQKFSDITLPYDVHKNLPDAQSFIEAVESKLS